MSEKATSKNDAIKKRNERIRQKFKHYTEKKRFAIDYALELLADDFLPLKPNTIWLIISQTGYYKEL